MALSTLPVYCLSMFSTLVQWIHSLPNPVPSVQVPLAFDTRTVWIEHEKLCDSYTITLPRGPHLFKRQQHELLCLGHLHEVLEDILVCRLEEVAARVSVSKASDAQAVGWIELAEQELAASIPHTIELKQAGSRKKCLAVGKNRGERDFPKQGNHSYPHLTARQCQNRFTEPLQAHKHNKDKAFFVSNRTKLKGS